MSFSQQLQFVYMQLIFSGGLISNKIVLVAQKEINLIT